MPPQGPPIKRRPQPQKRKRFTLPGTPYGDAPQNRQAPPAPPRRNGVFGPLVKPTFQPQRQQAARRSRQAREKLPARPVPSIPALVNPSPAQQQAGRRLVQRSFVGQLPKGAGLAERQRVAQELRQDPRTATAIHIGDYFTARQRQRALRLAGRQQAVARGVPKRYVHEQDVVGPGLIPAPVQARSHVPDTRVGFGPASVNLTAAQRTIANQLNRGQGVAAVQFSKGAAGLVGRAGKDLLALPYNAVKGAYEVGHAGTRAAMGDTSEARKLIGGLDEGPLGRLVLHGDPAGAAKSFSQHPLYGALEFSGAYGALGRTAGAAGRSGLLGAAAKAATQTARHDLLLSPGTNLRVRRSYSKNAFTQQAQKRAERAAVAQGRDPNLARPSRIPGRDSRLMNQAVDEAAHRYQQVNRGGREATRQAVQLLQPSRRPVATSRAGRAAVRMDQRRARARSRLTDGRGARWEERLLIPAMERRINPQSARVDIARERNRLDAVYQAERAQMSPQGRKNNRATVQAMDVALRDPQFQGRIAEVFRQAEQGVRLSHGVTGALIRRRALDPRQAKAAAVRPYAVSVMGARHDGMGLVDHMGTPVTTNEVVAHMRAAGIKPPGFVTHREDTRGARAYFQNWLNGRGTADRFRRTGESTRTGAHGSDLQTLEESLIAGKGLADRMGNFDRFINEFGAKRSDGKMHTWDEGTRVAQELAAKGLELVPVRALPAKYPEHVRQQIANEQDAGKLPDLRSMLDAHIAEARSAPLPGDAGKANVVLVPLRAMERFVGHQNVGGGLPLQLAGKVTGTFRNTVLPFSTKWLFGNAAEATLRSAISGITPRDAQLGRRVISRLQQLDAEKARQFRETATTGLLYGSAGRLSVHRENVTANTALSPIGAAAGAAARAPVVRQILGGLDVFTSGVFKFNKAMEREFQHGVVGKVARDQAVELGHSWASALRLQGQALDDVAKGLLDTPTQVAFARAVDDVLGKYGRFSPATRRITQAAAPFLPWYLNALRFVTHTLPVHHPVKTALLVNVERTLDQQFAEERKLLGKPGLGDLGAAIRLGDGGLLPVARYTPFGAWTSMQQSGVLGAVTDPILPQASTAYGIGRYGKNFFGQDLRLSSRKPASGGDRTALALYSLLESFLPGVSVARRLQEGGQTAYDNSTVFSPKSKPGTNYSGGAANRVLNPLRPTYLHPPAGGKVLSVAPSSPGDALRQSVRQSQGAAGLSPAELDALRQAVRGR